MEGNFPSSCSPPPSEKRKCLPRFSSSSFFISAIASAMCVRILGRMDVKCVNCFLSWYFLSFAVDYQQHPAQKKAARKCVRICTRVMRWSEYGCGMNFPCLFRSFSISLSFFFKSKFNLHDFVHWEEDESCQVPHCKFYLLKILKYLIEFDCDELHG